MSIQICEACGNPFDEAELVHPHARRIYDPFECAIHPPVPRCPRCGYEAIPTEPADVTDEHPKRRKAGVVLASR
jgi:hypothetical protein